MRSKRKRATSSTSRLARSTSRRTPPRPIRSSSSCRPTARIHTASTSTAARTARTTTSRPADGRTTYSLRQLLERHGLDGLPEEDLPNDGWSGSRLTTISRGPERFVLKRTSSALDWIVRATRDIALRESVVAGNGTRLVEPLVAPYLGTGSAGDAVAIL